MTLFSQGFLAWICNWSHTEMPFRRWRIKCASLTDVASYVQKNCRGQKAISTLYVFLLQICQAIWICFDGGAVIWCPPWPTWISKASFHSNGSMGMVTPFHVARSNNCPESPRRYWSSIQENLEEFTADCQSPAVDGRHYTSHPLSFWLYHLLVHPNH